MLFFFLDLSPYALELGVVALIGLSVYLVRRWMIERSWQEVADRTRAERDEKRKNHRALLGVLPDEKTVRRITSMSAVQIGSTNNRFDYFVRICEKRLLSIVDAIRRKQLSCEVVMKTFISRSMKCAQLYNSNTEECYEEALDAARDVDRRIASGDTNLRPLEGLPISVKDSNQQRGYLATCGFAAKCVKRLEEDGLLVEVLRDAGCIPFVRSNVPQALMLPESDVIDYVFLTACFRL